MNTRTRTSQATSHTSNSNLDMDLTHWREASSSEKDLIGICNCRKRSRVDILNEEVKGWTLSPEKQEHSLEPTNTKEDIRLEEIKQKVEKSALEWDDLVLQEQLKYLIYVDH